MTAANILSDELTRTRRLLEHEQAKRLCADMQAQAERDMCDAIADSLSRLVLAIDNADIDIAVSQALVNARAQARLSLDCHHEARFGSL